MLKSMLNRILAVILIVCMITCLHTYEKTTDKYVRNRTLLLHSEHGGCTGVKVTAPSGKHYILTASHCLEIMTPPYMQVRDEQGVDHDVRAIQDDPDHDLLLLESYDDQGVDVAKIVHRHEHIHAITHGAMMPSFRTDGEVLTTMPLDVVLFQIESDADNQKCLAGRRQRVEDAFPLSFYPLCIKNLVLTENMLIIWPGSSGGPVLNAWGELVGIVSVGGEMPGMSGMVPLSYIKQLLKNR